MKPNPTAKKYGYGTKYEAERREQFAANLTAEIKAWNHKRPIKIVADLKGDWAYIGWAATIRGKRLRRYHGDKIFFTATAPEIANVLDSVKDLIKELNGDPALLGEQITPTVSPLPESRATVGAKPHSIGIIDRMIEWMATYAEPNTRRNAQNLHYSANQYAPWAANPPVESITKGECERFAQWLRLTTVSPVHDPHKAKMGKDAAGRRLDPATVESRLTRMRTFFSWCEKMEYIEHSPAAKVAIESAPAKPPLFFTPDEINLLAKTPTRKSSGDMKAAFLFGCKTGLRKVDLVLLTFRQLGECDKAGKYYPFAMSKFIQHKTKLAGHVVLNDTTKKILLDQWSKKTKDVDPASVIDTPVFVLQFSTRLGDAFAEWLRDAGIQANGRTIRHMRHSCGSNLHAAGADARDIQLMLGHSNIRYTTSRYMAVDSNRLLDVAKKLR